MTELVIVEEEIQEDWSIYDIATKSPPIGWEEVFQEALPEIESVDDILSDQEKIHGKAFPLRRNMFRAFELTPLDNVKVVIFGQDPYHDLCNGVPRAQGMSFSVNMDMSIPPSLRNVFTEIKNEYGDEFNQPQHGDLSAWARQGILLLNSCLTVNQGLPAGHKNIWLGFIVRVIRAINRVNPNCIYVMWGKKAESLLQYVGGKAKTLTCSHPSPFSAHKGFYGCDHFKLINEHLVEKGKTPIDWNLPTIY